MTSSKKFGKFSENVKRFLQFGKDNNNNNYCNDVEESRWTISQNKAKRKSLDGAKRNIQLNGLAKFPSKFIRLVHDLINNGLDNTTQLQNLHSLSKILEENFYSEGKRLHQGRNGLLALCDYILKMLEVQKDHEFITIYRRILTQIIGRREFNLDDVKQKPSYDSERSLSISSFECMTSNSMSSVASDEDDHIPGDQEQVMNDLLHYRRLLVTTFRMITKSLENIASKPMINSTSEMEFYAKIIAVVYSRIPYVQDCILNQLEEALKKRQWEDVPTKTANTSQASNGLFEHALTQQLQSMSNIFDYSENKTVFGWNSFVPYIGGISDERLFQMNGGEWLKRITKDAEFLFMVVLEILQHIHDITDDQEIIWEKTPGYAILIEIALRLLKESSWKQWWILHDDCNHANLLNHSVLGITTRGMRTIVNNSARLLIHRKLMNCMILAVFESTNIFDTRSVGICLLLLQQWIGTLHTKNSKEMETGKKIVKTLVPWEICFDPSILSNGLKKIFAMESFETLKKALLFIYNMIDYFSGLLRQKVLTILLQHHYRLFLHWNVEVRSYYHCFLIYKVSAVSRAELESMTDRLIIEDQNGKSTDLRALKEKEKEKIIVERAYWRAFDACIAVICLVEREKVATGKALYEFELQCEQIKLMELKKFCTSVPTHSGSDVTESRPPTRMLTTIYPTGVHRRLPYYYRYLPEDETVELRQLCKIAESVHYRQSLRIYAHKALQEYATLLNQYYDSFASKGFAEAPPLGFC